MINKSKPLKIGNIVGNYYYGGSKSNTIVVYGIGAPMPPDNGNLPDAPFILEKGLDLYVPDYIGYGRSDGVFTPINCIKTFLSLYNCLTNGVNATNTYLSENIFLKYDKVIFIGRSFAAAYIPLLPKYNSKITDLAILCPVVDSKSCGSIKGEETNQDFLNSMKNDGYHHLYRGILEPVWKKHLENKDGLSPMDNIKYLAKAKLFIGHGKKDRCVHYSKSIDYYNKIIEILPGGKRNYYLKLYPNGEHGPTTTNPAVTDLLNWLGY